VKKEEATSGSNAGVSTHSSKNLKSAPPFSVPKFRGWQLNRGVHFKTTVRTTPRNLHNSNGIPDAYARAGGAWNAYAETSVRRLTRGPGASGGAQMRVVLECGNGQRSSYR